MKKYNYIFSFFLFFSFSSYVYAANHSDLIRCTKQFSLDGDCKLTTTSLESKQSVHSKFSVAYNMSCDPGGSPNNPSTLRILIETENGQTHEKIINYKTQSNYDVDGFGPVFLKDTNPTAFSSLKFNGDCKLNVNVSITKSDRTIQEEQTFFDTINHFVSNSKTELNDTFRLMVQFKADIFKETNDKIALACTIKKYDSDTLYDEIIVDLKSNYLAIHDEPYSSTLCIPGVDLTIADDCDPEDISRVCIFKGAYFKSRKKILGIKDIAKKYLQINNTQSFHTQLKEIVKDIDTWSNNE